MGCPILRHGARLRGSPSLPQITNCGSPIVLIALTAHCRFPDRIGALHTANVLMTSNSELPARWSWIRHLDADDRPAATSLATRRQARALLGEGAVRWSVAVGVRMARAVLDNLPDWPTDHSVEELDVLRRACEATTLDTLTAIVTGDTMALTRSGESELSVRYYVRRGITVDHVIRNVHTGQAQLTQELIDAIDDHLPSADRMATLREVTRILNESWTPFERAMTATYAVEYERWTQSEMGRRLLLVTKLLDAKRLNVEAASRDLCYRLDDRHVGAVMRIDHEVASVGINVMAMAQALAVDAGCTSAPLMLARGHSRADIWFADPQLDLAEVAAASDWPAGLMISLGQPGSSLEGFGATHREASAACRVGRLRGRADRVTSYAEVELLAVLTSELELAVAMARRQLGPLAQTDIRMTELRTTLAAYIDHGASVSQTAQAIHAHRNTINYRLRQVDRLLPTPQDRTDLRTALLLAQELPHLVLTDEIEETG